MPEETEIELFLYRGLNGTNPSAFRIDDDGLSVYENKLDGYKYNLKFVAIYRGERVPGVIANLVDRQLLDGIAEFTPQFGQGHWPIRFPGRSASETKITLSKYAKYMLK